MFKWHFHNLWFSTDETLNALKEAEKISPKVKVIHAKDKTTNINVARSIGMLTITADVIFTTDAHVEVMYGELKHQKQ
jgi:glycosyltransferase involved in cell wall biosynthesis